MHYTPNRAPVVDFCQFGSPRVYTLLLNRFLENDICRLNDFLVFWCLCQATVGGYVLDASLLQYFRCLFDMFLHLCMYECMHVWINECIPGLCRFKNYTDLCWFYWSFFLSEETPPLANSLWTDCPKRKEVMNEQGNIAKELLGLVCVCICIFLLSLCCLFSPKCETCFSFRPISPMGLMASLKKCVCVKGCVCFYWPSQGLDTFVWHVWLPYSPQSLCCSFSVGNFGRKADHRDGIFFCLHALWCDVSSLPASVSLNDSFSTLAFHAL